MRIKALSDVDLRYSQYFFTFAYLVLVIKHMFGVSLIFPWPNVADEIANGIFLCLVAVKLSLGRYSVKQLLGIGVVVSLCAYSSIKASYFFPLLSMLLVLSLQNVDLRRVVRVSYSFKAVIILIHIVLYIALIVIAPESITYEYRGDVHRHFFLFGHPNMFSAYAVWACLEFVYVNYARLRGWHVAVILLLNIVLYYYTDSRTGVYIVILIAVLLFFEKCGFRIVRKLLHLGSKYGFGICSLFSIALTVVYTSSLSEGAKALWNTVNSLLTGRLVYGAYAYNNYGFTWLGRKLNIPDKVYYLGHWLDGVIFDNSYQWLFIVFGTVFIIVVFLALFFTTERMKNEEKLLVFAYVIYAMMENYIVNVAMCFPLLFIGQYLYSRQSKSTGTPDLLKEETVPLWKRKSV